MIVAIPQELAAILPLFATLFSGWLRADRLSAGQNAAIAALALLTTAILSAWLAGNFIAGNPVASVLAVLAYIAVFMHGDLSVLLTFFEGVPSPFAPPPPKGPTAIQFPSEGTQTPPQGN